MKNLNLDEVQKVNLDKYRSEEMLEKYSKYLLFPEEKYLIPKYFQKGSSVLDLTCGAGRTTIPLYEAGYKVKGIDLSDVLIGAAQKRFPYIPFEVGNICNIHEQDSSYDNVLISFCGIDLVYPESEREKALAECARVLHEGGYFLMSSHNIKWLHGFSILREHPFQQKLHILKNVCNSFKDKVYVYHEPANVFIWYMSPEYVIEQVEKHGFEFQEMIGQRSFSRFAGYFKNKTLLDRYFSAYIHYVFRKKG